MLLQRLSIFHCMYIPHLLHSFTQMLFLIALPSFQALWVLSGCIQGRVCPGSIHMTRLSAPRLSSESAVSAFSPESDCRAEAGFSHHGFLFPCRTLMLCMTTLLPSTQACGRLPSAAPMRRRAKDSSCTTTQREKGCRILLSESSRQ